MFRSFGTTEVLCWKHETDSQADGRTDRWHCVPASRVAWRGGRWRLSRRTVDVGRVERSAPDAVWPPPRLDALVPPSSSHSAASAATAEHRTNCSVKNRGEARILRLGGLEPWSWRARERIYIGVWGGAPSGGPGSRAPVEGQGQSPLKLKAL